MQHTWRTIEMSAERQSHPDDRIRRVFALLGTALFLVLAPGCVAGLVPWWISRWQFRAPFPGYAPLHAIGAIRIAAGMFGVLDSFARFALLGLGTPAPVFPTRHLVVKGFYRYVRNPMYVAVVAVILGQALLFGDVRVFKYGLFAWLVARLFVLAYEEPTLRKTFGAEYESFRANVPRWIPRLAPWRGGTTYGAS
jgi:protein-S-isoprenylcysteine O-methyltransferase Ste14